MKSLRIVINETKRWHPDKVKRFREYMDRGLSHKEIAAREGYKNGQTVSVMVHRYRKQMGLPQGEELKAHRKARNVAIEKLAGEYSKEKTTYKSKSWAKKVGKPDYSSHFTGRIAQKVKLTKNSVSRILTQQRRKKAQNNDEITEGSRWKATKIYVHDQYKRGNKIRYHIKPMGMVGGLATFGGYLAAHPETTLDTKIAGGVLAAGSLKLAHDYMANHFRNMRDIRRKLKERNNPKSQLKP